MIARSYIARSAGLALVFSLLAGFQSIAAPDAPTAKAPESKTVRLLTVGNSFSGNATKYLGDLAKADGNKLILRTASIGGASMELHATKVKAHERDPADKAGLYGSGVSLSQMLKADRWDYVTIQQASIKSHDLSTFRPFAAQLRDTIRTHAPQAELLVHQTWAYRRDDPRFTKPTGKPGEPVTQEAMYQGLSEAYRTIASELGTKLIPVGDAFFAADTHPEWSFRPDTQFDSKTAKAPALPNQTHSLHMGWRWKKEKDGKTKLGMDGHHANSAGEYLGACVWYEVLFGKSAEGNSFIPRGLDPEFARFLQTTAHQAVIGSAKLAASPR